MSRTKNYTTHCARSPAAHFDEFVYSAQVTLPEESDQLGLYRHSASTPGAMQLTLTSSYTLDRSRYLRSQISSGYIATRLYRHSASAPGATQLTLTSSSTLDRSRYLRSQISSGYIATRLYRHSASAPGATQLTLTSSSTLDRSRYLRSQISSGNIATWLYRHSASAPGATQLTLTSHLLCTAYAASGVRPAQATSPFGYNATKATVPGA